MPDLTSDELDRPLGDRAPDVVVVPALPDVDASTVEPVTDWPRRAPARWSAKVLEHPVDHLDLTGPAWPWTPSLRPLGLAVLGVLVALGLLRWRTTSVTKRARSGRSGPPTPAASVGA
ncbi:hypothetical protein [Umezawaea sp.]|uniref:hypothetical protein n=1 Tax=Umezawaea sp. TaxID=1955258 RepID=UPI002ED64852